MSSVIPVLRRVCAVAVLGLLLTSFLTVSLNIHPASGAGGWWNTDWQYRRMITIDHTKVSADLANFPVLVNISDSDLVHAQPDGRDIVFTDYYGNRLNHELESSSSSEYFIPFASHAIAPAVRYSGNPVFGPSVSGWDSVNVRDPTFLINDTGYAIQENGEWVVYYLGSGSGPSWGLGRAVTTDYIHWTREPDTMLLSIGNPGQWDDTYFTSGASVVKRSTGEYVVSYIGKDSSYFTGIGLANSSDGVHFTRFDGNPILNQSQFNILGGSTTVSMSYLYHLLNGTWVILFEASVSGGASCFGAMSEGTDPYGKWVPMNGGEAIFEGAGTGWDANDVCNPKLYEMSDGQYVLGYNGESPSNGYTLGWAYGTSLTSWTRYSGNPILGWGPTGAFDAVRVENTIVQKQQLENPHGDMTLVYFACPGGVQVGDAWGIATIPEASRGDLSAWVDVPTLSSTQDTVLYMYYGNPSCGDQQNASGVWDSNFKMVQHLNQPIISSGPTQTWTKYSGNPVLAPSGSDENAAAYASVLIVNGVYHMYYSTRQTSTGYYRIAHATSSDGKSWTKDTAHNPVLDLVPSSDWENCMVYSPIVWIENGVWYMIYTGRGGPIWPPESEMVGLATSSDGLNWVRSPANPILTGGLPWEGNHIENYGVIKVGSTYYMEYGNQLATDGYDRCTGIASSTDLTHWTKDSRNPIWTGNRYCGSWFKRGSFFYHLICNGPGIELYRDTNPTFYPEDRQLIGTPITASTADTPWVLTNDIYKDTFPNNQLWTYYSDSQSGWVECLTIETNIDAALAMSSSGISIYDSTTYHNDGTSAGSPAPTAGKIAGGANLYVTGSDAFDCGNKSSLDFSSFTLEAWVKLPNANAGGPAGNGWMTILEKGNTDPARYGLWTRYGVPVVLINGNILLASLIAMMNDTWAHIVATHDGTTTRIFVNGVERNSTTGWTLSPANTAGDDLMLGHSSVLGYTGRWEGSMDEVRVSNAARSAAWVSTEYNSQNGPSAFLTFGSEEQPSSGPSITIQSVGISSPSGSIGGTVSTGETFVVDAKVALSAGSTSVGATIILPSGYTLAGGSAYQTQIVGTSAVDFFWSVNAPSSATASAPLTVDASAAGYSGDSRYFSVTTVTAASLTGSLSASPGTVTVGNIVTVTMTVNNVGTASANTVSPTSLTLAGTGAATLTSGPTPSSTTITGGGSASFAWTYTTTSAGTVQFTGSASGTNQYSGDGVSTATLNSNTVTVNPTTSGGWWDSGWQYRKSITIDHTKVAANLTNFPVLVDIVDSGLQAHAQSNGNDIVFTSYDGSRKLNHEIELYNSPQAHLVAWVNVPALSMTQDTVLYMYYGNPASGNQQNASGVWDSNFVMVQHLGEVTSGNGGIQHDSTINKNNMTTANGVTTGAAGEIDGAVHFDGVDDQVYRNELQLQTQTISLWFESDTRLYNSGVDWDILVNGGTLSKQGVSIQYDGIYSGGTLRVYTAYGTDWGLHQTSVITFNATTWHHLVFVYDRTADNLKLYVDNSKLIDVNSTTAGHGITYAGGQLSLGYAFTYRWLGTIDEVRMSNITRSAEWIATEYYNQKNPTTFYTIGTEESYKKPTLNTAATSQTCRKNSETFTTKLNVSDALNVIGFKFEIHYNTTLLDYGGVTWTTWGTGTITVDEANGNITGTTLGTAISGTWTLATIQFNTAYYHVWKDENWVSGWKNNQTGIIFVQWANLSYAVSADLGYLRGGLNQINVGPDTTYTFSPIQGDVDNSGTVNIFDLRTVAAFYDQASATYDLNGDNFIDIFDLVIVASNYGFTYP